MPRKKNRDIKKRPLKLKNTTENNLDLSHLNQESSPENEGAPSQAKRMSDIIVELQKQESGSGRIGDMMDYIQKPATVPVTSTHNRMSSITKMQPPPPVKTTVGGTIPAIDDQSRVQVLKEMAATRTHALKTQGTSRNRRNINFANLLTGFPTQPLGVKFEQL